ncbi:inner membrane-spanning protein YciB [Acuticoccus kandeliae]|uniref:inner membrane-spanning protein YciB n=1 Tax=Acuticoccus kandeliae TaxID=2073160 RepID=UPI000D3ED1E2|nr:septation protein IspZ [Acuticoccus kandeliae]
MASALEQVNTRKLFERFAIEMGPALVFVLALVIVGLNPATVLFVVATGIAAGYSWYEKRHFPYIPAGMLLMTAVFGGLTIVLDNASYIQFRATLVNAGGALAITIGLMSGHLVLKKALQDGFRLTDAAWWTLSIRMALYLAVMATLNEIIRRAFSTEIWAWFKAGSPLLNVAFLAANWPLIRAHLQPESGADARGGKPNAKKLSGSFA